MGQAATAVCVEDCSTQALDFCAEPVDGSRRMEVASISTLTEHRISAWTKEMEQTGGCPLGSSQRRACKACARQGVACKWPEACLADIFPDEEDTSALGPPEAPASWSYQGAPTCTVECFAEEEDDAPPPPAPYLAKALATIAVGVAAAPLDAALGAESLMPSLCNAEEEGPYKEEDDYGLIPRSGLLAMRPFPEAATTTAQLAAVELTLDDIDESSSRPIARSTPKRMLLVAELPHNLAADLAL